MPFPITPLIQKNYGLELDCKTDTHRVFFQGGLQCCHIGSRGFFDGFFETVHVGDVDGHFVGELVAGTQGQMVLDDGRESDDTEEFIVDIVNICALDIGADPWD